MSDDSKREAGYLDLLDLAAETALGRLSRRGADIPSVMVTVLREAYEAGRAEEAREHDPATAAHAAPPSAEPEPCQQCGGLGEYQLIGANNVHTDAMTCDACQAGRDVMAERIAKLEAELAAAAPVPSVADDNVARLDGCIDKLTEAARDVARLQRREALCAADEVRADALKPIREALVDAGYCGDGNVAEQVTRAVRLAESSAPGKCLFAISEVSAAIDTIARDAEGSLAERFNAAVAKVFAKGAEDMWGRCMTECRRLCDCEWSEAQLAQMTGRDAFEMVMISIRALGTEREDG